MWEFGFVAEFAVVAVGDEGEGAEVEVFLSGCEGFYAEDLGGLLRPDQGCDLCFDDCDVGGCAGGGAELLDEASMVEGAAFGGWCRAGYGASVRRREGGGVGDLDGFVVVGNVVAHAWDCFDVFETVWRV